MKKIFIIIAMAIVAVATQAQVVFLDPEGKEYADGQTMTINSTIDPDWGDVVFEAPDIKNVGDGANVYLNVDIKALPANTAVQECFGTNCYYFNLEGAHDTQSLFVGAGVTRSTATQWQCYDAVNDDFIYGVCTVVFTAYVNGAKSCAVTVNYLNSDPAGINTVTINDLNYILNSTDRSAIVSTQSTSLSGAISIPSSVTYSGTSYSVKELASKAFQNCDGISSISIPNSVKTLGQFCFANTPIQTITIPSSVTSIGNFCFNECTNLTNATINANVTSLPFACFQFCSNLTTISIPSSVTSLGTYCFSGCSKLSSITLPSGLKKLNDFCFSNCSALTEISLPASVTSIGSCFGGCSSLSKLTCNATRPPIVTSYAFDGTLYQLGTLLVPESAVSAYQKASTWKEWKYIEAIVVTENRIYLTDATTAQNTTKAISVSLKNDTQITNFQFDVYLPEGVTMATSGGDYVYAKGSRATNSHSITCAQQSDGAYRFFCYSASNALITGNDGEIMNFTVQVPSSTATGDYTITIKNAKVAETNGTKYTTDETSASLTVTAAVVPVSNITLNSTSASLNVGETTSLTATITPDDATNKSVTWSSNNTEVATVDENGVVTAVAAGTAAITVTAADGSGVSASCEVTVKAEEPDVPSDIEPSTDVSALTDALYFNDVENRAGDFNLELNLKCAEENITAFQCDVYLPEGVEWKYTVDKRGKIIYDLPAFNEDRTDASYHTIAPIEQKSDGSYSIIVYSGEEEYILDLDGAIMTLPLTVSEEMEAGDYNIIMKNIVIVPTEGSKISIDKMVSRLTIPSYMIGDANGDDAIDVADIVATIAYMRNHPSENFIFAAADVNEDNAIDVADIVGIIRIMRSEPSTSASKHNSARLASAVDAEAGSNLRITPFAVEQGTKEKTVTLDMNNPGEEFTAFQCDVYFPEGIEWKTTVDRRGNKKVVAPTFNVEADRTNALYHTIDAGYNADGSMSVIVYSSDMEIILDEKGAVLDLPFVLDENLAAGVYDIKLKNVKLSRVDATKAEPADYTFSVVVGSPSGDIALKGDYTGTNEALKLLVDGSSANVTCENLLLDDEDGYTVSNTFTAESVSYSRPMTNEWGTVCLPYAVQSDDNVAYYNIIDVQNGTLTIQKYETLPANTPALMQKVNGDAAVCEAHDVMVGGAMNNVTGEVTMHGSYANNIMVTDANAYYIKNNKFWLNNQYFYIDAFRAYFTLAPSAAKSGCLSIGDIATAIDTLTNGDKVAGVWSTNGVMRNNVEKGMNIIKMADGKCVKVLVK